MTPWTAACQASLSITISWSLLKLMSIESVIPTSVKQTKKCFHTNSLHPSACSGSESGNYSPCSGKMKQPERLPSIPYTSPRSSTRLKLTFPFTPFLRPTSCLLEHHSFLKKEWGASSVPRSLLGAPARGFSSPPDTESCSVCADSKTAEGLEARSRCLHVKLYRTGNCYGR